MRHAKRVLDIPAERVLAEVQLPEQHAPCLSKASDGRRVLRSNVIHDIATRGRPYPFDIELILHRDRQPMKRSPRSPTRKLSLSVPGGSKRAFFI